MNDDDFLMWDYWTSDYTTIEGVLSQYPNFSARPDIVAALVQHKSAIAYIEQQAQIEVRKAEANRDD